MKNKKGSVTDLFIFIAIGFFLLIFIGVWIYFSSTVGNILGKVDGNIGGGESIGNISNHTLGVYNTGLNQAKWIPVAFFFGMAIFILISGFLVRVSPIFFFVYIIVVIIAVIVSVPISNFYMDNILTESTLGATFQTFTASNYIMEFMPLWIAVIGIFGTVFLVINWKRGEDLGGYYG